VRKILPNILQNCTNFEHLKFYNNEKQPITPSYV
jgi:hypothetical protein